MRKGNNENDDRPSLWYELSDKKVSFSFGQQAAQYAYHYVISEPENAEVTHLMTIEKLESDMTGAERYECRIVRECDRMPDLEIILCEYPEKGEDAVKKFYENYNSGFMICLIRKDTSQVFCLN